MAIKKFEDVIAWKKSQDLAVTIYQKFYNSKDFGFRDQIFRAVVSISNNIAEGFERSSKAEFIKFLFYSISSCGEVRSMLYLSYRLNYISISERDELIEKTEEISKIIKGLIKSIQEKRT